MHVEFIAGLEAGTEVPIQFLTRRESGAIEMVSAGEPKRTTYDYEADQSSRMPSALSGMLAAVLYGEYLRQIDDDHERGAAFRAIANQAALQHVRRKYEDAGCGCLTSFGRRFLAHDTVDVTDFVLSYAPAASAMLAMCPWRILLPKRSQMTAWVVAHAVGLADYGLPYLPAGGTPVRIKACSAAEAKKRASQGAERLTVTALQRVDRHGDRLGLRMASAKIYAKAAVACDGAIRLAKMKSGDWMTPPAPDVRVDGRPVRLPGLDLQWPGESGDGE